MRHHSESILRLVREHGEAKVLELLRWYARHVGMEELPKCNKPRDFAKYWLWITRLSRNDVEAIPRASRMRWVERARILMDGKRQGHTQQEVNALAATLWLSAAEWRRLSSIYRPELISWLEQKLNLDDWFGREIRYAERRQWKTFSAWGPDNARFQSAIQRILREYGGSR